MQTHTNWEIKNYELGNLQGYTKIHFIKQNFRAIYFIEIKSYSKYLENTAQGHCRARIRLQISLGLALPLRNIDGQRVFNLKFVLFEWQLLYKNVTKFRDIIIISEKLVCIKNLEF